MTLDFETKWALQELTAQVKRIADHLESTQRETENETVAYSGLKPAWAALLERILAEDDHYERNIRDY